jgi:SpoVK/Ycf46/Vps4 family AAA+-type ATPase
MMTVQYETPYEISYKSEQIITETNKTKKVETNLNQILGREPIANELKKFFNQFDQQCKNVNFKKGIYIYGSPGCGKTRFITDLLKELDYDIIKYDAGDVRNKALIDTITSDNISNRNVLQMMARKVKKIAIVMDEIDGMNNGDKGGITALIKLIRQKKTKKQKLEHVTLNPIICIGNYYVDKKIKELMKVCYTFELKTPTANQTDQILCTNIPTISDNPELKHKILNYIQGDMRKLDFIQNLYYKTPELMTDETLDNIFHLKSYNEDSKKITQALINRPTPLDQHHLFMNETDRTIVALLYHENIVDPIAKLPTQRTYPFYQKILDNMCFADYIDRITFQNQIWIFNEMSSLMKTFHNNKIYHDTFPENRETYHPPEVRFTKVLTKYSTEYNNQLFIYNLSQELDMDKKDLVAYFQELRIQNGDDFYSNNDALNRAEPLFENYNINKLDIKRMYRYLDKNVKKDALTLIEDFDDDDGCEEL